MGKQTMAALLIAAAVLATAGCSSDAIGPTATATPTSAPSTSASPSGSPSAAPSATSTASSTPSPSTGKTAAPSATPGKGGAGQDDVVQVVAEPESITVLVNKQFKLPEGYNPQDLVYPDVPFTFKEKIEKRKMRKEAAAALENMFAGASKDGIELAGVSAYRSHATQTSLFNSYVAKDGREKALTYSALPGTSEHETGLAIDVSGITGKCAATDCFAGTKEAVWLEKHAPEYGFIIRYPKGKDAITGYQYEPWHLRYVGVDVAKAIAAKGITLEEYFNAVPISK